MKTALMPLLAFPKSVAKLILRPKAFAAGRTIDTRLKFHGFFRMLNPSEVKIRKDAVANLTPARKLAPITEDNGFRKLDDLDPELVRAATEEGRKIMRAMDLNEVEKNAARPFLAVIPFSSPDRNHPLMRFALDESILKMVGEYMGLMPVIENILFWYSPNRENFQSSSQYYHLDSTDVRTVQILLFLEDIDENSGPFVLVDAKASEKLARKMSYRKAGATKRISDELVAENVDPSSIHTLTGPAGTVFLCDSDRCFHYGSRKATKPRFIIAFQYFSPFSFQVPFKWWNGLPLSKLGENGAFTPLEKIVLGAPPQTRPPLT